MAIRVELLKAGDVLYDCHNYKAGNTTMTVEGVWECYVKEVGTTPRRSGGLAHWALISWNGNRPTKHYGRVSYRRSPKEWNRQSVFGERTCYLCHAKESAGHRPDCEHPRAVRARKAAE